jgi:hypothetical protein
LFFVDADTTVNSSAIASALRQMDKGAAGGGAPTRFDESAPLYAQLLLLWLGLVMRLPGISGGAFMFCTRESFQATGGFDKRLFGRGRGNVVGFEARRPVRGALEICAHFGRRMRNSWTLNAGRPDSMAFFPGMLTRRSRFEQLA